MSDYLANLVQMQPNIYQREIYNTTETHTTNADKLRTMSDEELAEWIETIADCDVCPMRKNCRGGDGTSHGSCRLKWLDWLRQEAQDG